MQRLSEADWMTKRSAATILAHIADLEQQQHTAVEAIQEKQVIFIVIFYLNFIGGQSRPLAPHQQEEED